MGGTGTKQNDSGMGVGLNLTGSGMVLGVQMGFFLLQPGIGMRQDFFLVRDKTGVKIHQLCITLG